MIEFTEEQLNLKGFDFIKAFYVYPKNAHASEDIKRPFALVADLKHFYDLDLARYWYGRVGRVASRGDQVIGTRLSYSNTWDVYALPDDKTYDEYECELIWRRVLIDRATFKRQLAEKENSYLKHIRYDLRKCKQFVEPRLPVMNEKEVTAFFEAYLKYHLQDPSLDPIHNFTDALKVTFTLGFSVSVVRESEFNRFGGKMTNTSWLGSPFQDDNVQVCIEHFENQEIAYGHGVLIGAMVKLGLIDCNRLQLAWNALRNSPNFKKQ
jgi:hypothetical protein